jgi:hypothetical protein
VPAGRATRRLRELAQLLEPEAPPWYVRRAELPPTLRQHFPADGWYWVPHAHHVAVYAGATEIDVALMLHRMIDEREAADANR